MVASSRNTVVATSAPSSLSGVAIHTSVASFLVLPYLLGGQPINNTAQELAVPINHLQMTPLLPLSATG